MKALVLEGNRRLRYTELPVPGVGDDECLVEVSAAGVCGSDIPRAFDHKAHAYPLIMGHEFSGRIVECGRDVRGRQRGERVVAFPLVPCFRCPRCEERRWALCRDYAYYGSRCHGAFGEYLSVKAWNLLRVPDGCGADAAALCEPLAVCVRALRALPVTAGRRLAIIGGGFIGLSLAKLAQRSGRFDEIRVLDRNRFKLERAERLGVATALVECDGSIEDAARSAGGPFEAVIEACGAPGAYRLSVRLCADLGHVLWLGNIAGTLALSQPEVSSVLRREISIHGVWNSDFQPDGESDWTQALALIAGEDWVSQLLSHRVPLKEGKALLEDLHTIKQQHRQHTYLKTCFVFGQQL